jgi:N-acetyl-anhydromuramyl-L-alanine amidase AmpD
MEVRMNINTSLRAKNLRHKAGRVIHGIVLHDTAGSGTSGDVGYLANDPEHRGVSVDYVITRDGVIWKLNPDPANNYTFHAGRHTKFHDWLNGSVNAVTIGIELSHKANPALQTPEWPKEQVEAAADLCKMLCETYHIAVSDITTHQKIITDRTRTDPRNFPFPQFWARFNGDDDMVVHNSVPTADTSVTKYTVVDGDTLWGLAQKFSTTVEAIKHMNNMNTASNTIVVGQSLRVK